jgi:hypothetical protein
VDKIVLQLSSNSPIIFENSEIVAYRPIAGHRPRQLRVQLLHCKWQISKQPFSSNGF